MVCFGRRNDVGLSIIYHDILVLFNSGIYLSTYINAICNCVIPMYLKCPCCLNIVSTRVPGHNYLAGCPLLWIPWPNEFGKLTSGMFKVWGFSKRGRKSTSKRKDGSSNTYICFYTIIWKGFKWFYWLILFKLNLEKTILRHMALTLGDNL